MENNYYSYNMFDNFTNYKQCYYKFDSLPFSREQIIFDTMIVYYLFSIILSKNKLRTNIYNFFQEFNNQIDIPSEKLTNKDKTNGVLWIFDLAFKIIHTIFYTVLGFYLKCWLILKLYHSLTNLIKTSTALIDILEHNLSKIYTGNNIIIGMVSYSVVSMLFDKSFVKNNIPVKFLCITKDMFIGCILFMNYNNVHNFDNFDNYDNYNLDNSENLIELIKYTYYLAIKLELLSLFTTMFFF